MMPIVIRWLDGRPLLAVLRRAQKPITVINENEKNENPLKKSHYAPVKYAM